MAFINEEVPEQEKNQNNNSDKPNTNLTWANIFKKINLILCCVLLLFFTLGSLITQICIQKLKVPSGRHFFEKIFWLPLVGFFLITFITIILAETSKKRRNIISKKSVFVSPSNLVDRIGIILVSLSMGFLGWLFGVYFTAVLIK